MNVLTFWEKISGARYSCVPKNSPLSFFDVLALVWAKFHDIWKIIHPFAYAENQEDGDYPFAPEIIKTHVCDWVKMAQAFNLPDEVIRFISTHHWTSMSPSNMWDERKQYEMSQKPVSVEETLVMLADSSEAAIRSLMQQCTKESIAKIIKAVFQEKEERDQLRNSVLLAWDFNQVESDFIDTFYYVYHRRFATEKK